jgi:hypothetical protein
MLERNVMSKTVAIFVTVMITAPLPAIAHTQADVDACKPGAIRLCVSAGSDLHRVALCLAHKKSN